MIDRYMRPAMKRAWSEEFKYEKWLEVELAICEAWTDEGIIPQKDMVLLRSAKYDAQRFMDIFQITRHDVTAFVSSITEGLGNEGRWLHLGITSSDLLDTALGLQLIEAGALLLKDMDEAILAVHDQALKHKDTIMIGRTHGVHAEPTTFGLKLALWWEELRRQRARMVDAIENVRVGKISGAVGTYATVPPSIEEKVCYRLKLQADPVSNQIIQRDRYAHFVTTLALVAASLEKFATEIRSLQRTEIHEIEEPFGQGQTGSSSMPHKRNPELAERICGLARLIRGYSVTALENVALWGERDISHSSAERIILPDSCLALDYMFSLFTQIVRDLRVFPDRMRANLESSQGLVFSQRVLLAMIERGQSRENAYKVVQWNASRSWDNNLDFRELLKSDPKALACLSVSEMDDLFDYSFYTRYGDMIFKRLGLLPG
jgi:adenylosuccinate lyase